MTNTPFNTLDPDSIIQALEAIGFKCSGSLYPLNSFENRVYHVGMEDAEPVIAKFYRPHRWSDAAIVEEHEFALELVTHEIPVIAPLVINDQTLFDNGMFRFAIFPCRGGRALELDNMEHLEWMGRFIARIHAVGATRSFKHRQQLNVTNFGHQPYQFLLDNHFIPEQIKQNYCSIMEVALNLIQEHLQEHTDIGFIRIHGDMHAGNVLWRHDKPHIVDLDDCLTGPAIQDIWMLLSGNKEDMKQQLDVILDGYYEFYDFNPMEIRLIESLRTLRMIHYAGWLAKRWEDPAFPINFPWFNTPRYWENQLHHLREQVEILEAG